MENANIIKLLKNRKPKNLLVFFRNSLDTTYDSNKLLFTDDELNVLKNAVSLLKVDYARKTKDNYQYAIDNNLYSGTYTNFFHQDYEEYSTQLLEYLGNYDPSIKELSVYLNVGIEERLLTREVNVLDSRIPIRPRYDDIDIVILKDPNDSWFMNKIEGIGDSFVEVSKYIEKLIEPYQKVLFIGDRKNAFGSLLYGSNNRADGIIATNAETEISFRLSNLYNSPNPFVVLQPYLSVAPFIEDSTNYYIHPMIHPHGKQLRNNYYFDNIKYNKCCRRDNVTRLHLPNEGLELSDFQKNENTLFLEKQIKQFFA